MVDIVLRAVGGSDITLDPVNLPAPPALVTLYLYPIVAPAAGALPVITLDAVAGGDLLLRNTSPAPSSSRLTIIVLRPTGAPESPPAGEANALAGVAVAGAMGAADLGVISGIELGGDALAGAVGDAGLTVGVDLAGEALAGATADAALEQGIELAGDAVAGADAAATLTGGTEEEPQGFTFGGSVRPRPRPRWKRDEDAIAAMSALH